MTHDGVVCSVTAVMATSDNYILLNEHKKCLLVPNALCAASSTHSAAAALLLRLRVLLLCFIGSMLLLCFIGSECYCCSVSSTHSAAALFHWLSAAALFRRLRVLLLPHYTLIVLLFLLNSSFTNIHHTTYPTRPPYTPNSHHSHPFPFPTP